MPGLSFYDKQHIQKVAAQQAVIANIFNQFILSVSPYLRKWFDPTAPAGLASGLNLILMRYADVLLMYAEAKTELGEMNEAIRE